MKVIDPGWDFVLAEGRHNRRADILGAAPDTNRRLKGILADLTVERLVQLANVCFNRCDPKDLNEVYPNDLARQSQAAWHFLESASQHPIKAGTRWERAAERLRDGERAGLAQVREMDLDSFATACMRVVSGPYRA